jgi:hypothetical protein
MEFLSGLPLMAFRSGHRGAQNHFALQDDLQMVASFMTLEGKPWSNHGALKLNACHDCPETWEGKNLHSFIGYNTLDFDCRIER